jgi:hypothetical protein
MLANDNFFMLAYFKLALRRNFIEATSAGIALYCNHG